MNAKRNSKVYDFFKLVVALILVAVIVILLILLLNSSTETEVAAELTDTPELTQTAPPTATEVPEPTPVPEPTAAPDPLAGLPDLPEVGAELTYNPDDGLLYSPHGNPVYELNAAASGWNPYISDDLAAGLPEGAALGTDGANGWQINDLDGNPLYRWNPDTLSWDTAETPETVEPDLPLFPETAVDLVYVPETEQLVNADGLAIFQLDAENSQWLPVIPEEIAADLPEGAQIVQNEIGLWEILDSEGTLIYTWDWITLAWVTAEQEVAVPPLPEAPSQDICPLAMVPRLAVGATARAINFQNFRSSPEVADNLVYVLAPTSEVPVVGGPTCVEYAGGAHLWWQVTIDDGTSGWMAEGSADGLFYFLEPVR